MFRGERMKEKSETVEIVSMIKVNILVLIAAIGMTVCVSVIHVLLFGAVELTLNLTGLLLFLAAMIVFVCIHEGFT